MPQIAIGRDQAGPYVLTVGADDVVQRTGIQLGKTVGPLQVVQRPHRQGPRDRRRAACARARPQGDTARGRGGRSGQRPVSAGSRRMFSKFFIDRPIFAGVVAIVTGARSAWSPALRLPVAQYPNITPPTIYVTTSYPGANASTVANTVGIPIEQQVNGVPGMLYMQSYSASDGTYTLIVTFDVGSDMDTAQTLVYQRVAIALAQLPPQVSAQGVTVSSSRPASCCSPT